MAAPNFHYGFHLSFSMENSHNHISTNIVHINQIIILNESAYNPTCKHIYNN